MEERVREVQSVWEQRKESLAELEKTKEEMEYAKRKAEEQNKITIEMKGETGNQETTPEAISKQSQDDLVLFRALAEKLGESFESVGVTLEIFKLQSSDHHFTYSSIPSNYSQHYGATSIWESLHPPIIIM